MNAVLHNAERWLVLDAAVWNALRREPGARQGLLALRIAHGLLAPVPLPALGARLAALAHAGAEFVHLVVQRLDAPLLTRIRTLAPASLRLSVHDWYRSPLDALGSVDAPDAALLALLAKREARAPVVIWPPIGPLAQAATFRAQLRRALSMWEEEARAEHGEEFDEAFGEVIAWSQILPDETPTSRFAGAAWRTWIHSSPHSRHDRSQEAAGPRGAGLAWAMSGVAAGGHSLNWTYSLEGGGEMALRIELPSRAGANVEVLVALGPGVDLPAGFAIAESSGDTIVSASTPQWLATGTPDAPWVCVQSFADEFGELRGRLRGLPAQPDLVLLPA